MELKLIFIIVIIIFLIYLFIQNSNMCSVVNRNEREEFNVGVMSKKMKRLLIGTGVGVGVGVGTGALIKKKLDDSKASRELHDQESKKFRNEELSTNMNYLDSKGRRLLDDDGELIEYEEERAEAIEQAISEQERLAIQTASDEQAISEQERLAIQTASDEQQRLAEELSTQGADAEFRRASMRQAARAAVVQEEESQGKFNNHKRLECNSSAQDTAREATSKAIETRNYIVEQIRDIRANQLLKSDFNTFRNIIFRKELKEMKYAIKEKDPIRTKLEKMKLMEVLDEAMSNGRIAYELSSEAAAAAAIHDAKWPVKPYESNKKGVLRRNLNYMKLMEVLEQATVLDPVAVSQIRVLLEKTSPRLAWAQPRRPLIELILNAEDRKLALIESIMAKQPPPEDKLEEFDERIKEMPARWLAHKAAWQKVAEVSCKDRDTRKSCQTDVWEKHLAAADKHAHQDGDKELLLWGIEEAKQSYFAEQHHIGNRLWNAEKKCAKQWGPL